MNDSITLVKVNEVRMRVICDDPGIHEDLYYFFRYEKPNYTPNPFSKKKWDGVVRLYSKGNGLLDIGLMGELFKFCQARNIKVTIDPLLKYMTPATDDEVMEFFLGLDIHYKNEHGNLVPAELRGYQFECIRTAITSNRCVLEAATSAGKSMVIYSIIRYCRMRRAAIESKQKTLIVVPSQHLVLQLMQDCRDYSHTTDWDADQSIHLIYDGATKVTSKGVIISTWQGIQDQPKEWFQQFGDIVVDEVHLSAADKLSYIMDSLTQADFRLGVTGTLSNTPLAALQVTAHFGKVYKIVSARELIDMGYATDIEILMLTFQYNQAERFLMRDAEYKSEIEFLIGHEARNQAIIKMCLTLKGNTIIMFERIDAHMMVIYEELKKLKPNVYMNNGQMPVKERRLVQALVEAGEEVTLLGSYGTISTGVSIKKLHNLVLGHPTKSYIRVIQTIGRMMRQHSSKKKAMIIDIIDDLKTPDYENHALRHSRERYKFYVTEKHPVKFFRKTLSVEKTY